MTDQTTEELLRQNTELRKGLNALLTHAVLINLPKIKQLALNTLENAEPKGTK